MYFQEMYYTSSGAGSSRASGYSGQDESHQYYGSGASSGHVVDPSSWHANSGMDYGQPPQSSYSASMSWGDSSLASAQRSLQSWKAVGLTAASAGMERPPDMEPRQDRAAPVRQSGPGEGASFGHERPRDTDYYHDPSAGSYSEETPARMAPSANRDPAARWLQPSGPGPRGGSQARPLPSGVQTFQPKGGMQLRGSGATGPPPARASPPGPPTRTGPPRPLGPTTGPSVPRASPPRAPGPPTGPSVPRASPPGPSTGAGPPRLPRGTAPARPSGPPMVAGPSRPRGPPTVEGPPWLHARLPGPSRPMPPTYASDSYGQGTSRQSNDGQEQYQSVNRATSSAKKVGFGDGPSVQGAAPRPSMARAPHPPQPRPPPPPSPPPSSGTTTAPPAVRKATPLMDVTPFQSRLQEFSSKTCSDLGISVQPQQENQRPGTKKLCSLEAFSTKIPDTQKDDVKVDDDDDDDDSDDDDDVDMTQCKLCNIKFEKEQVFFYTHFFLFFSC